MGKIAKLKIIFLLLAVCLAVTVLGVALRDQQRPVVITQDTDATVSADTNMEMNNVSYSSMDSDNFKQWDLDARTARVFEDGRKLELKDLTLTLYQRAGRPYTVSAAQGNLDMETRNIDISGNVVAVLPDTSTVETQSAMYDHAGRTITTHDQLTIRRGAVIMQGVGMIVDLNKETFSILSNVKVTGNT